MAIRLGKFKIKNGSGIYDQVMMETKAGQIVDGPFKSLERGATYVIGDVAVEATCPGAFLVCTTAGKTAASVPSGYASAAHFGTVTDGAAKFQVHFFKNVDEVATQAEAEAGTNNIKVMTALRVAQAMAKFMSTWSGNEYIRKHIVTATSTGQNGYIKFGDWFGGLILQWGLYSSSKATYAISVAKTILLLESGDSVNGYQGSMDAISLTSTGFSGYGNRKGRYLAICQ